MSIDGIDYSGSGIAHHYPVFCVFLTHWDCIYLASPNLAKTRARRESNDRPSLAKFGEVDTVPGSE